VPDEHARGRLEVARHDAPDDLWIEPLGEARPADEVGEDDRHRLPGLRDELQGGRGVCGALLRRLRERGRGAVRPGRKLELGVLDEDPPLELLERRARLDPESVDEDAPGLLVGLERLGLAARPVQRQDQLPAQTLA
jgi:hypothetical protein